MFFLYPFLSFYLESFLPIQLQDYLQLESEREITSAETILLVFAIPIVLAHLVSIVGIIFVKTWAKKIYVYSILGLLLIIPFTGPYVAHAVASTIGTLTSIIDGIIIGLLFFSYSAFNKSMQRTGVNASR